MEVNKDIEKSDIEIFDDKMHNYGRISTSIIMFMLVLVPFIISAVFDVNLNIKAAIGASIGICILFLPASLVEVMTYAPMLGTGATYLAFITGNLTNLKIPCCMNARNLVGTEFGTKENEIVSTISVAVSSVVTCLVIAIGVLMMAPLEPIINSPQLQPAFSTVVPALFGALGYQYIKQIPQVAFLPFLIISVVSFFIPELASQIVVLIAVSAIISIIIARILYKNGRL